MKPWTIKRTATFIATALTPLPDLLKTYPSQPEKVLAKLKKVLNIEDLPLFNPTTTKCMLNVAASVVKEYPHCRRCFLYSSNCPWRPEIKQVFNADSIQAIIMLIPEVQQMTERMKGYAEDLTHDNP